MNTKTITIYSVPVEHAEHMAARGAGMGISLTDFIREMFRAAMREYAYVVSEKDCFSLANAETGEPIPGSVFYHDGGARSKTWLEARRLVEVRADEMGYLVWHHDYGDKIPPGMMTSDAPAGNE